MRRVIVILLLFVLLPSQVLASLHDHVTMPQSCVAAHCSHAAVATDIDDFASSLHAHADISEASVLLEALGFAPGPTAMARTVYISPDFLLVYFPVIKPPRL